MAMLVYWRVSCNYYTPEKLTECPPVFFLGSFQKERILFQPLFLQGILLVFRGGISFVELYLCWNILHSHCHPLHPLPVIPIISTFRTREMLRGITLTEAEETLNPLRKKKEGLPF